MEHKEDNSSPCNNPNNSKTRDIFSEFMAQVIKLEELVELGRRTLVSFRQALEFLRRVSIHETSKLIQTQVKEIETKSDDVKSYVQCGCSNVDDSQRNINQLHVSSCGLHDHVGNAKAVIDRLESLMEEFEIEMMGFSEVREKDDVGCDGNEEAMASSECFDGGVCASFMAKIYSMVKQDYVMQEKIVSSLGLKTPAGQLDSYCKMWSLRAYVDEDIIHEALRHVR